jgi:uncharacterized cupredoxin-like copper-binding protein
MRRAALFLALLAIGPAATAAPEWRQATDVELRLANFAIDPGTIHLKAGQPVRLRLINNGQGSYTLNARGFFTAATVRQRDANAVTTGSISVPSGQTREIVLAPARGSYRVYSTNLFYRIFGMRGQIEVD